MSNEKLIEMYRQTHNEDYATQLYEKNIKLMHEIANKYKLDIDICYMGFTKALNKFDATKGKFTTILYMACDNECKMYLRKRQVPTISLDTPTDDNLTIEDTIADEFDFAEHQANVDLVSKILALLSPRQREIVSMRYIADLSIKQIAQRLGLSTQSVANTLNKATNILRGNYAKIRNM